MGSADTHVGMWLTASALFAVGAFFAHAGVIFYWLFPFSLLTRHGQCRNSTQPPHPPRTQDVAKIVRLHPQRLQKARNPSKRQRLPRG